MRRPKQAEKLASQDKTISSESILTHVRQLNITHRDQLLKKFQLLHFTVSQNLSFRMYNKLAMFEKDSQSKPRKLVSFRQEC